MPRAEPIVDRFWKHVVEIGGPMDTPCWVHRHNPNCRKNWHIGHKNGNQSARVWAYTHIGRKAIPDGHVVLSYCDNAACCNPKHLFTGTRSTMMKATAAEGRIAWAHLRRFNAANAARFRGLGNPNAKYPEAVVEQVRAMFGKATAGEASRQAGMSKSHVYRIWNGTQRPPHTGESGRYLEHGHRGHATAAHGRQSGIGDGQAAAHQDPGCGHREPHGTGAMLG